MSDMHRLGFVIITDFVPANAGRDVSDEIQKVILDNPNKTIYFPDGEYLLSKPICTPGNPVNAVSLELSTFACLRATEDWDSDEALVRLGAAEPYNDIYTPGSNYYFTGGIIDGSNKANGISIDSGRETCIHHVSIKNTRVGIHIKWGANSRSSDADVHSVNIVGNNAKDSIGVWLVGHDNTLTNMRIASVHTGILAESGGNTRFIFTRAKTRRSKTISQALRLTTDGTITITTFVTVISSVRRLLFKQARAISMISLISCGIQARAV